MIHVCVFFFVSLAAALQELQQVEVEAGQNVLLQCGVPRETEILMLEWKRADLGAEDYVFFYREKRSYERYQHPSYRGRVTLRKSSSVEDGDVSVVLHNSSMADTGTYECVVTVGSSGSSQKDFRVVRHSIKLTVAASGGVAEEDEEEEEEGGRVAFVETKAALSNTPLLAVGGVLLVVSVAVGLMCWRKSKTPQGVIQVPPEQTLIQNV